MTNRTKLFMGIVSAFVLGVAVNNFAMSDVAAMRIAVVDVPQVVEASAKVQALKKEQQAKAKELNAKREVLEKDYAKKLAETDAAISAQIANIAKANNYDLVISKNVVLYGGTDITAAVKAPAKK